jgi:glutamine amidotransferase
VQPLIAIVDYGAGNLKSIENCMRSVGARTQVASHARDLEGVCGVVLPGVGSFGYAVSSLSRSGLSDELRRIATRKPLLGICLGMQMLFSCSEESPGCQGLGILPGRVQRLSEAARKVPNMGWCAVTTRLPGILGDQDQTDCFYFAHSYACVVPEELVTASEETALVASVRSGLVYGVQFHPEKSGEQGRQVLSRFVRLCSEEATACC